MAGNRGVETVLSVFLLCCWQDVRPLPNKDLSGSKPRQLSSFKTPDDDIATVFDEILAREILEPGKTSSFEDQSLSTTPETKTTTKNKKVHKKKSSTTKKHETQVSSGTIETLSFDDEEKETLFQIKSLDALEKIIDTIRRAIGSRLKNKQQFKKSRRNKQLLRKLI